MLWNCWFKHGIVIIGLDCYYGTFSFLCKILKFYFYESIEICLFDEQENKKYHAPINQL